MAEYIEKEALLAAIDCEFFKTDPDGAEQIGVLKCRRIAHTLPAADVAPVVRCGECERRNKSADLSDSVYCRWLKTQMRKSDFCSYGERRSE